MSWRDLVISDLLEFPKKMACMARNLKIEALLLLLLRNKILLRELLNRKRLLWTFQLLKLKEL
jgi:hypothetical protein